MATMKPHLQARRVTALVLGDPAVASAATWMEIGPRESGVTVMSEQFARRRLPPPALAAMRESACFYMCVTDLDATARRFPAAASASRS